MVRTLFHSRFLRWTVCGVLIASGAIIIWNSRFYFLNPIRVSFLLEQPLLAVDRIWRAALAIHVAGGMGCLVSLLASWFSARSKRWRSLHRASGRFYAVIVLMLLCPSGLFLSVYAKGGWLGKFGFMQLCALTFVFTLWGTRAAIERKLIQHRKWMTRSMAMVASAMTFRISQIALAPFDVDPEVNYIASLYLSIFGNWLVVEVWMGTRLSFPRPFFGNSLEAET